MKTLKQTLIPIFLVICIAASGQGITNSGGYITATQGNYVSFNGSSNQYLKGTVADQTTFSNLVVDMTGSGTYRLYITDDAYITVDDSLKLLDTLQLNATSSGMASLCTKGTITGSRAVVEQYISQSQWHLVSAPVSGAKARVYSGIYLKRYLEPTDTWQWVTNLYANLNIGQGYAAYASSNSTVDFRGLLNTGDKTPPAISYTSGQGNGWNLIGNPYPSALEWNSSWTKSNVDATVYVYDGTQYLTWNYNLGGYGTMSNGMLPSTQGFWIKANASSPSITIPNSERAHDAQGFYKSGETLQNLLKIRVTGNSYSDITFVGFCPDATEGFDSQYDAYKLQGIPEAPKLFTTIPGEELSVNFYPICNNDRIVPLNIEVGAATTYVMTFEGLNNFNPFLTVFLEDKGISTGTRKLINIKATGQYTFSSKPGDSPERFLLHFRNGNGSEDPSETTSENSVTIYSYSKSVYLNLGSENGGTLKVYDTFGKEVYSSDNCNEGLNRYDLNLAKGCYIIKYVNNGRMETQKVFID